MNETNEKTPLTPEQVAAKNREVAMYYKIVCTLSRNLHCSPNKCHAAAGAARLHPKADIRPDRQ